MAGVDKALKSMLDINVKSYMYVLNYTLQGLNLPKWYGVPHNTEYLLASGAPFMDHRFYPSELKLEYAQWTESDRNMSLFFMVSVDGGLLPLKMIFILLFTWKNHRPVGRISQNTTIQLQTTFSTSSFGSQWTEFSSSTCR